MGTKEELISTLFDQMGNPEITEEQFNLLEGRVTRLQASDSDN